MAEATVDGRGAFLAAGGGGEMVLHDPVACAADEEGVAGRAEGRFAVRGFDVADIDVVKT